MRMKRPLAVAFAMLALASAAATDAQDQQPPERTTPDELYREAVVDEKAGSLYDPVLKLLEASRRMPMRVDLGVSPVPIAEDGAGDTGESVPPKADAEQGEPPLPSKGAPSLKVVDDEDLAYALYMSGRYAEARDLYTQLVAQRSEDPYLAVMLMLCRRNVGDAEATDESLDELAKHDETREWAEWLSAMIALHQDETEEVE